jgi:L-amino acid N-acyltransferase YncA
MSVAAVLEVLSRPVFLAALWAALMAQGVGVVGLAALAGRVLPGGSAAARSSVWGWAFAALLALPLAPLLASLKVLERAGFRREGHFRESLPLHERWEDCLHYAILRREQE